MQNEEHLMQGLSYSVQKTEKYWKTETEQSLGNQWNSVKAPIESGTGAPEEESEKEQKKILKNG